MNAWILTAIIAGIFVLAIIGITSMETVNADSSETISCETCGGKCTAESNCGLATCGAVSGTGSCGCGR